MTCPAVLTVIAGKGFFSAVYQLPCANTKQHGIAGHKVDLSKLPIEIEGQPGTWTAKIRL